MSKKELLMSPGYELKTINYLQKGSKIVSRRVKEEIEFVSNLTRIILSSPDIARMCERFTDEIRKTIPVEWASIITIKGENLYFQSLSSRIKSIWKTGDVVPLKDTATEYIATTKQILSEPDLSKNRRFWTGEYHLKHGIRSIVYIPLLAEDRVFGALVIASTRPDAYGERELKLLYHTAGQIAMPIKNAILLEEIKKRQRLLEAINNLTRTISSYLTLDNVYEVFAMELKKLVPFDRLSIALIERDKIRYLAVSEKIKTERRPGSTYPLKDTNTGWVAKHKETLIEPDLTQHRVSPLSKLRLSEGIRSTIHAPLFYKGRVFGTINLSSLHPDSYGEGERGILEHLCGQLSGAIMNARLYKQAKEESRLDALTGLFNRRYFNERLEEKLKKRLRYGGVFSLILCDLDFFKRYNDRYGHIAGDKLIRRAAGIMKKQIREVDLIFRYGGDEFVILLPEADSKSALSIAERMREGLGKEMKKRKVLLTASLGIASCPVDGIRGRDLLDAADSAAYEAKNLGGNQCILASGKPQRADEAQIKRPIINLIEGMATALEARDIYTYSHSRDVNKYAQMLGKAIGLSEEKLAYLSRAALLHDIGKIGITDRILYKKQRLSSEDWEVIKRHPSVGAEIIGDIPELLPTKAAILYHHERWDGGGYPSGLKGKGIPLEARMLAIADAFSAMISARPYRPARSYQEALLELKREAGKQFDPELANTFTAIVKKLLDKKTEVTT